MTDDIEQMIASILASKSVLDFESVEYIVVFLELRPHKLLLEVVGRKISSVKSWVKIPYAFGCFGILFCSMESERLQNGRLVLREGGEGGCRLHGVVLERVENNQDFTDKNQFYFEKGDYRTLFLLFLLLLLRCLKV